MIRVVSLPILAAVCATLSMTACARSAEAPSSSAPTPAVATSTPPAAVATATVAPQTAAAVASNNNETPLERVAALPAQDQLPAGKWVPGKNYLPIVPAQPTNSPPGKVEVVEVYWYGCGHCYALDPYLESWKQNKPAYVEFVRVPVMWGPAHKAHAHLFYTLQALGRDKELHTKVFDAVQRGGKTLLGSDEAGNFKAQLEFAMANGISEKDFTSAYNSFGVNSALQRAEQLTRRYRVEGVPLMVVNGKYSTDVGQAGGQSQLISLINDLAAAEKRR